MTKPLWAKQAIKAYDDKVEKELQETREKEERQRLLEQAAIDKATDYLCRYLDIIQLPDESVGQYMTGRRISWFAGVALVRFAFNELYWFVDPERAVINEKASTYFSGLSVCHVDRYGTAVTPTSVPYLRDLGAYLKKNAVFA